MRDKKIDIAKGIGIVLVVLGHCSGKWISAFIYLFHMPLFFLISGYLYNEKSSEKPLVYIKKKFWGLYIPYLLTEIFFTIIRNWLLHMGIYSSSYLYYNHYIDYLNGRGLIITICKDILLAGREPMAGTLWFSVVLIFVSLMFLIISVLGKKIEKTYGINKEKIRLICVFVAFFVGNLATRLGYTIPRCNNALVMLAIYYIGVRIRQSEINIICCKLYLILCFCILGLNVLYGGVSVNGNEYLSPVFLITNCLIGAYIIFGVADMIQLNQMGNIFENLGKHSLTIMFFHFSAFKLLSKILVLFFKNNHLYEFPVIHVQNQWIQNILAVPYLFIGILLPYTVAVLYEKIKINVYRKCKEIRKNTNLMKRKKI